MAGLGRTAAGALARERRRTKPAGVEED